MRFSTTKELAPPIIVLQRPWDRLGAFNDRRENFFVDRDENVLGSLDVSTTSSREKSFDLEQGLPSSVSAALRALSKNFPENISISILSSELYTRSAKKK